ncbi:MAG: hypothetical protein NTZ22_11255, partial [Hyphomicrobiales bacterium]|nr:hypothetical protein [Hyphomicrobiales bacterium]
QYAVGDRILPDSARPHRRIGRPYRNRLMQDKIAARCERRAYMGRLSYFLPILLDLACGKLVRALFFLLSDPHI